jgi:hypothetical protein
MLITPIQNKLAIAASTAEPFLLRISTPIFEHLTSSAATAASLYGSYIEKDQCTYIYV